MIHPAFAHIVGQTQAKEILSLSLYGAENGGDFIQPMFFGQAGLGKTELARAYGKAAAEILGVQFKEFATPRDFANVTEFDPVLDDLTTSEQFVYYFDEIHELDNAKVSHVKFKAMIRKCLDRQNDGKEIQIADRTMMFNRKNHVFIFATNHPEKVDTAVKDRCNKINLQLYNQPEMIEITERILEKNSLQADSLETMQRIARCGRGTARPIVSLVQDVFKIMPISEITTEIAMKALRMKEMYPAGLTLNEMKKMDLLCKETTAIVRSNTPAKTLTKAQIVANIGSGVAGGYNDSVAFLSSLKLINVERNGSVRVTSKGQKYMAYCADQGFTF